jgi:2-succinyl-6-hydroxy-2,4-cyclohexadiene-1-carboxylate synthase
VFASTNDETRCTLIRQKMNFDRSYQAALLRCYSIAGQPDFWPQLGSIQSPVAVVVGEQDQKYVAIARQIKECETGIQVYIVPSAGHAVHCERPEALQAVLQTFYASLPQGNTFDE